MVVKLLVLLLAVYFLSRVLWEFFWLWWFERHKVLVAIYWNKAFKGKIYEVHYPWGVEYVVTRINWNGRENVEGTFETSDLKSYLDRHFTTCGNYELVV